MALGLTASAFGQTWVKIPAYPAPTPRDSFAGVFNPFTNRVLVYGGKDRNTLGFAETWTWNGKAWTLLKPQNSPKGKWSFRMVLDWYRRKVVLFGGRVGTKETNDTWEWDGKNWTQVLTKNSPSKRRAYGFAYDMKRKVCVLFGGQGFPWQLGDTWEYDGKDWKQVKTANAPTPRSGPCVVYDESRGVCVLFGGWDQKNGNKLMNDTWEYDGKNWTKINTKTLPGGRYWHNIFYDRIRGRVVMYGGLTGDNTTWEYDGKDWKAALAFYPPASSESAVAYDWIRRRGFHFGGSNRGKLSNEVWEYQGVDLASYAGWGSGCKGSGGVPLLAAQAGSLPKIGKTFSLVVSNLPVKSGYAVLFFGTSHDTWGKTPLPFALDALGMTGCALEVSLDFFAVLPAPKTSASGAVMSTEKLPTTCSCRALGNIPLNWARLSSVPPRMRRSQPVF